MSPANPPEAHGLTGALARCALSVDAQTLPADTLAIARHCLLDWFTLVLASWQAQPVQQLRQCLAAPQLPPGVATLLGSGERTGLEAAALVNGLAGHVLDFDDAHLKSRVHPSVPLWPAILAWGEHSGASGADLLAAFVAGVQVQSRLAAHMGESHYRQGWHNTATLGSFGAAAAVGALCRLDEAAQRHAFGIVATMAGGLRAVFGTPAKPLQAGRAAANGLFAASLARTGFAAAPSILDGQDGFPSLYARQLAEDAAMRQPGHWCVRDIVFKYHASCYGTQAPIDAARALAPIDRASVAAVRVYVEPQYLDVCNIQTPRTEPQAKFSVRHTVALALAGRDTAAHASFLPPALADPQIAAWRELVSVHGDPALARANARVEIETRSGERRTSVHDASRPQADLQAQQQRLLAKSGVLLQEAGFEGRDVCALHARLLEIGGCGDFPRWMRDYRRWLGQARANRAQDHHQAGA
ncbi:MmgE/PrpD family protein [Orrella sp. JC864]|uniref:MmgE/PrpD family protein n=1 Tax=Orrella sp. JC864 TaxID=3120298 RepID=UPI00300BEE96